MDMLELYHVMKLLDFFSANEFQFNMYSKLMKSISKLETESIWT